MAALDCVDFTYQVDGLTVEGYYLKPKNAEPESLPVVIYNRGGNAGFGYVVFGAKMQTISELAEAGYLVIGSQYRGSSRWIDNNGQDEFGGGDVNDVLALRELLTEIPEADPSRLAMVGWSRGGMQTFLASRQMPELKTIVSIAGVSDLRNQLKQRPEMENVYKARIPDYTNQKAEALSRRSAIDWADELPDVPVLLVHGTADKRVDAEQSRSLAAELERISHPSKLEIYEGDNHGLVRNRENLRNELIDWLNTHMSH